jgi:hypothetical protein
MSFQYLTTSLVLEPTGTPFFCLLADPITAIAGDSP